MHAGGNFRWLVILLTAVCASQDGDMAAVPHPQRFTTSGLGLLKKQTAGAVARFIITAHHNVSSGAKSICRRALCRIAGLPPEPFYGIWICRRMTDTLARRVLTCGARGYLQKGRIGWLSFRGPAQCVPAFLISLTVLISQSIRPRAQVRTTTIFRFRLSMHIYRHHRGAELNNLYTLTKEYYELKLLILGRRIRSANSCSETGRPHSRVL